VPKGKIVKKITEGSIHFYTGELSKKNGLPIICSQGSPAGADVKKVNKLLEFYPDIIELALMGQRHPLIALNADTGLNSPTATGGAFNDWTNPTNAYSSNNVYAVANPPVKSNVKQSYENFSFGIPAGATINGMEASLEWYKTSSASSNGLYFYCTSDATDYWKSVSPPATEGIVVTGASDDLWSSTPIDTDFSDANFHITVYIVSSQYVAACVYLDHIQVKVYYTEAASGPANLKSYNGLAKASIKSINGLAIASIKSINGLE